MPARKRLSEMQQRTSVLTRRSRRRRARPLARTRRPLDDPLPLRIAFLLRSFRGEKLAGLAVVLAIFISACVALYETIVRLIKPQPLTHLWVLAAAGAIGFLG